MMSPAKTLYVRDTDTDVWQRAESRATQAGQSLSAVIAGLLATYTTPGAQPVRVLADNLGIRQILVVDRDLASDQDFDPTSVTPDDETARLEWNRDGWRLWHIGRNGDPDDYLLCHQSHSADEAIESALRHLTSLRRADTADDALTVEMRDAAGRAWTEGFRGRWLIEPDDGNRYGSDAGACYGIAQTAKGKIAVYVYHVNDGWPPALEVYDGLDEAQADLGLSPEAVAIAADELGQERVVWRDI